MKNLIKKYEKKKGPYYTSYPSLSEWSNKFSDKDYTSSLEKFCSQKEDNSLALYIHFPFCKDKCYFCICNANVTNNYDKIKEFLDFSSKEVSLFKEFFDKQKFIPKVKEIHLGGGSPNIIGKKELDSYLQKIQSITNLSDLEEFSIEVDVRYVDEDKLKYYKEKGINRLSFGIQDFDPNVQRAVNRIQSRELVERLLSSAKEDFKSINFDLLYGLPLQTRKSFKRTIETVKELSPDRITLLRYCHLPEQAKIQRLINEKDIPDDNEKTKIFIDAVENLKDAGYEHVGIDHFAKPHDELAIAMKNKTLWRNFNGFTPEITKNIIGIGPASTSNFGDCYAQNVYLSDYYKTLENKKFPILKGHLISKDDFIRRDVINLLLCNNFLDFQEIGEKHGINPKNYFKEEINSLNTFVKEGLIELSENKNVVNITPSGRFFVRYVCKVFDSYLKNKEYKIHGL